MSSTTVVRALQDLVIEGYLIRRQGEGTFVRRNLKHKKVYFDENGPLINTKIKKKTNDMVEQTATTIHRNVVQKDIAKLLELNEEEQLTQIVQLAMIDNFIWKIQIRYVADSMLTDEMIRQFQSGGSLSEEYKLKHNLTNLPMKQEIKFGLLAGESTILNLIPEEMANIEWPVNLPVVKLQKKYFDNNKKPIEFSYSLIHHQHYSINIEFEGI
ncbi:GntR family transcriptional regulator [Enterococcus alcedinis]|uniref:GntR family transcriptional regulator n=1 Tax=Enterococcus alcedinis TaxID=1274384 RepID=UPI003617CB08